MIFLSCPSEQVGNYHRYCIVVGVHTGVGIVGTGVPGGSGPWGGTSG